MKIPKIIHQVYEDPNGPSGLLKQLSESWRKFNPDWEYIFWDKPKMETLIKEDFPDFMETYKSFPHNVQRWDAIRYLILYKYGGLYVDMDYECLKPINDLLAGKICCLGQEAHIIKDNNSFAGNAFMASVAGYGFWKEVINEMKTYICNYHSDNKFYVVMHTTGPFMITRVYKSYANNAEIYMIPAKYVAPLSKPEALGVIKKRENPNFTIKEKISNAYAIHYFMGSWM